MTNLQDDWFCLGIGSPNAPDPLISCIFKTELVTRLKNARPDGLDLRIGPTIEYSKKPGKIVVVKSMKDPSVIRGDLYKSSTIHVGPGESPNSTSKPTPKGKQLPPKPITTGKLLRPGGPKGGAAKNRPTAARPIPQEPRLIPQPRAMPVGQPAAAAQPAAQHAIQPTIAPRPAARTTAAVAATHNRTASASRPPPPPPPAPAPAASSSPMAKAKFDFTGQSDKELAVTAGQIVELLRKEENGWWLVKYVGVEQQGWAPSAYLEEVVAPIKKAAPPPPPRPNGVGKAKPPAPPKRPGVGSTSDRHSAGSASMATSSGASSGESFAGGLAEAVSFD